MQFCDGLPLQCPPGDVERGHASFFKAVSGKKPAEKDFQSFAELDRPGTDKTNCMTWGLSVWPDIDAVNHARKIFDVFRRKKIMKFSVGPDDGVYLATPLPEQEKHHTFWKCSDKSVLATCEVVLEAVE